MDFQKPIMSESHMVITCFFIGVFTIIGISEFPIQEYRNGGWLTPTEQAALGSQGGIS